MRQYDGNNIDDLLIDVKNLLDEDQPRVVQRERTLRQKMETEREAERIAEIMRGAAEKAERETRAYGQPQETRTFEPIRDTNEEDTPRPRVVAYNTDFSDNRFRENFQPRRQEEMPRHHRPQPQERAPKKKKRGSGCLTFLLVLIVLIGLAAGALMFFGTLTRREAPFERKEGMSSVLIAGTDKEGLRTDTIMLVSIDEKERTYNVMSIPRDTLTYAPYSVPKINAAYGYYGCGEEGMAALLDLVEDCVGFRPDGYVLIDWDGFAALVDLMGGIEFDVPMEMEVDGIELQAGTQHLDGHEALTVARFRAGYSLADLQRIEVQRQLIDAALDQWITVENILKLPSLIDCVNEAMLTDLNVLNILWLARDLKVCTAEKNITLPGAAQMIGDGSYYVLDPQAVADAVNAGFNPYTRDITPEDLYIKVG